MLSKLNRIFQNASNDGRLKQFVLFGLVGGFGILINTLILYFLTKSGGMNYLLASAIATETAIISNFIGNNYITFKDRNQNGSIWKKFASFQLISLVSLFGTMLFLYIFVSLLGQELLLLWNFLAIIIMFIANFALNIKITWNEKNKYTETEKSKFYSDENSGPAQNIKNFFTKFFLLAIFAGLTLLLFGGISKESNSPYQPDLSSNQSLFLYASSPDSTHYTPNSVYLRIYFGDEAHTIAFEGIEFKPNNKADGNGKEKDKDEKDGYQEANRSPNRANEPESKSVVDAPVVSVSSASSSEQTMEISADNNDGIINSDNDDSPDENITHQTSSTKNLGVKNSSSFWNMSEILDLLDNITPSNSLNITQNESANQSENDSLEDSDTNYNPDENENLPPIPQLPLQSGNDTIYDTLNDDDEVKAPANNSTNATSSNVTSTTAPPIPLFNQTDNASNNSSNESDNSTNAPIPIITPIELPVSPIEEEPPEEETKVNDYGPQVIYALFKDDLININESQKITVDAKFKRGISGVDATVVNTKGRTRVLNLNLTIGDKYYGTWSGEFIPTVPGDYKLKSVTLHTKFSKNATIVPMENIGFYALGKPEPVPTFVKENLTLIYSALSRSKAENGTVINLTIDAKDYQGITGATAFITSKTGINAGSGNFSLNLSLVAGEPIYGTWSAPFVVDQPDTTYSISKIILYNNESSKEFNITGRSTYVFPLEKTPEEILEGNAITGFLIFPSLTGESWTEIIQKPLVPTILGFVLMIALVTTLFSIRRTDNTESDKTDSR